MRRRYLLTKTAPPQTVPGAQPVAASTCGSVLLFSPTYVLARSPVRTNMTRTPRTRMSMSQQQRPPSGGDDRIRDTRTSGANLTKKMVRSIPVSDSTKCAVTFAFYTPDDQERNNRKMSQVCHHRGSKGGGVDVRSVHCPRHRR